MTNLMIVDDEVYAIRGIREGVDWSKLKIDGIYTANSAEQARRILLQQKIDIILCDIEMPQENGICFIRWLREKNEKIKCIFLTCHADFNFVQEALRLKSSDYLLKPVAYDKLENILSKTIEDISREEEEERMLKYGEMYLDNKKHAIEEKSVIKKSNRDIVEEVKKLILEHLKEDVSVEQYAKQVFLNPDYLTRIFRREMGCSIVNYIIRERLRLASRLLMETDVTINEIAVEVGYPNYSHFTKMFRQIFGVTPSLYRQKYRITVK
ncbi:response regulator transcription factor [Anaerocolumna jejuensis]|uniref:response regulator transcription factor n=1 Tax=Anaerocolumna jejuensis TaxID=259063 RepID=UPI003F7B8A30